MLIKWQLPLRPVAIILDAFTIIVSFYLSYWTRLVILEAIPFGAKTEFSYYYSIVFTTIIVWMWLLTFLGAYERPMFLSIEREIKIVLKAVLFGGLILLTGIFLLKAVPLLPRSFMLLFFIINVCLLTAEKVGLSYWVGMERRKGLALRPAIIVVENGNEAVTVIKTLLKHTELGLKPIGLFCTGYLSEKLKHIGITVLGKVEDFASYLYKNHVDEVVFTTNKDIEALLNICEEEGISTRYILNLPKGSELSHIRVDRLGDIASISLYRTHEREWQIFFKRAIDICISSILLILLSPLLLFIAIIIKLTSRGPVFYEWKVVGFNKKPFLSWKFRSMVVDADRSKDKLMDKNEMKGPVFKMKSDPRITPVGNILRRFSLDELPQLFSVLKGDMSLVGPRPPLTTEIDRFEQWHGKKLRIKPGITCLWQVNGRNEIQDFDAWVRLDLEYIENWSLWLDTKILLKTISTVLRGTGQ